jgi:uncharacterized protein (DUF486 family)
MDEMDDALKAVGLLILSNTFMTMAWLVIRVLPRE